MTSKFSLLQITTFLAAKHYQPLPTYMTGKRHVPDSNSGFERVFLILCNTNFYQNLSHSQGMKWQRKKKNL